MAGQAEAAGAVEPIVARGAAHTRAALARGAPIARLAHVTQGAGPPTMARAVAGAGAAVGAVTAEAARALGVSTLTIMFRHLLPNAMVATLTFIPFILNASITTLTSLDFLGFGLPPGSPSLGELLAQGKANLQAPWLGLSGFFTIAIMLSLLIFIGEAVRDAFDPRKTLA